MRFRLFFLIAGAAIIISGCGGDDSTNPSGNRAPNAPGNPNPANNAVDVSTSAQLTWQCSDPDGDPLTYDVYLGTQQPPSLVTSNQGSASYQTNDLSANSAVYWMITAKDTAGNATNGPVWRFTTEEASSGFELIGHYNTSGARVVFVAETRAYLLTGAAMMILDVSNPANPHFIGSFSRSTVWNQVFVSGTRAFLLGGMTGYGSITAVDISNPAAPVELDVLGTSDSERFYDFLVSDYSYEVYISIATHNWMRYLTFDQNGFDLDGTWDYVSIGGYLVFANGYCYGISYSPCTFRVFLRDQVFGSLGIGGTPYDIAASGTYAYIALGANGLRIIDVSTPTAPSFAGSYSASTPIKGLAVQDNIIFVAADSAGVIALNMADPSNPVAVDSYDTDGNAVQIFYLNGYIYVAATDGGLYILRFDQ